MSAFDNVFRFGEPRPSATRGPAQATDGGSGVTAARLAVESAEFADSRVGFKKLPDPTGPFPFRMRLRDLIGSENEQAIAVAGRLVFHSVGDTGQRGHGALAQERVALHMEKQLDHEDANDRPAFFYHLGDVVYYNGELEHYPEQFYDPYRFYRAPIVAIPGNHDGDGPDESTSLRPFVRNFCTTMPVRPPMPGLSRRQTMTQPNVYFTLETPFATIIGLYSNVTGHLDRPGDTETPQFDWLINEMREADPGKFLVVAVHHPPYSADNSHGGQAPIARSLDQAIEATGRLPHLVLTAHVHNFQYFKRETTIGQTRGTIEYLVAGAGGYAGYDGLHQVNVNDVEPGVELKEYNDDLPGFLRLSVTSEKLTWEYFTTPKRTDHGATLEQRAPAFSGSITK